MCVCGRADLQSHVGEDIVLAVVGNKSDCASSFDFAQAQQFADQIGALVFRTSAKSGDGVQTLFEALAAELLKKHEQEERTRDRGDSLGSGSGYGGQSPVILGRPAAGSSAGRAGKGGCC